MNFLIYNHYRTNVIKTSKETHLNFVVDYQIQEN